MRTAKTLALAAVVTLGALGTAADARPAISGEQELAKLLAGRVAEAPRSCIGTLSSNQMRTIDGTALVFGHGRVIYVNRTRHPRDLDEDDVMVVRKFGGGSRLCSSDLITTIDRSSRIYSGNVFLGEFVPYRKVK